MDFGGDRASASSILLPCVRILTSLGTPTGHTESWGGRGKSPEEWKTPASLPTSNTDQRRLGDTVAARSPETCRDTDSKLQKVFLDPEVILQTGDLSQFADKGNTQEQTMYGQIADCSWQDNSREPSPFSNIWQSRSSKQENPSEGAKEEQWIVEKKRGFPGNLRSRQKEWNSKNGDFFRRKEREACEQTYPWEACGAQWIRPLPRSEISSLSVLRSPGTRMPQGNSWLSPGPICTSCINHTRIALPV